MKRRLLHMAAGILAAGIAAGSASAQPAGIPDYLKDLTGTTPMAPGAIATRDVLQLNVSMFTLYDASAAIFQRNIMAGLTAGGIRG